jgi:serine/threonine protein kinase/tetratricopeptide (TPR) repeat protein
MTNPSNINSPPSVGTLIGGYRLEHKIGTGGNASVYRAKSQTGKTVAVKILHSLKITQEDLKRFQREFDTTEKLNHPNIVSVYETGIFEDYPWLAMEYIDGGDLAHQISAWKDDPSFDRFPAIEVLLRQILEAISYVHRAGFVHRDLKPTNILIRSDGTPMLSDFGVVKSLRECGTQLTSIGKLVGTIAFMAPEQIASDPIDARTDLYALGALLYLMLTLKPPIDAPTIAGYLARHLTEVPRPPRDLVSNIPEKLSTIATRLLLKAPSQRYSSAEAVTVALDQKHNTERLPLRGCEDLLRCWRDRMSLLNQGLSGMVAIVGEHGAGKTHTLATISDLTVAEDAVFNGLTGETPNLVESIEQARASTEGPLVITVDDLHLAPAIVLNGLGRVVRLSLQGESEPLVLLFSSLHQKGHIRPLIDGTITGVESTVLALAPLNKSAVVALLRDHQLSASIAAALGSRLSVDHHGNAGDIIQTMRTMLKQGWLEFIGDQIRANRPLKEILRDPLPVDTHDQERASAYIEQLSEDAHRLIALVSLSGVLAVNTLSLLMPENTASVVLGEPALKSLLLHTPGERRNLDTYELSHPVIAKLLLERLSDEKILVLHQELATALQPQRREHSDKIAHHLVQAKAYKEALPYYIYAAKRASRSETNRTVIQHAKSAISLIKTHDVSFPDDATAALVYLLWGGALYSRGRFDDAKRQLLVASEHAQKSGDSRLCGKVDATLGRAYYRLGVLDISERYLRSALRLCDRNSKELAAATRTLADILLQRGALIESGKLWRRALDVAMQVGKAPDVARAKRGLAHLTILQGKLSDAATYLDEAEELLASGQDDPTRASILARLIELDTIAGRFGAAIHRAEQLTTLADDSSVMNRHPQALSQQATVLLKTGDPESAHKYASRAVLHAHAAPILQHENLIIAARVLCSVGRFEEAAEALAPIENLPANALSDLPAQIAALHAWTAVEHALEFATAQRSVFTALRAAPIAYSSARACLDAAHTFCKAGDATAAHDIAKNGLSMLGSDGTEALRLELLVLMQKSAPSDTYHTQILALRDHILITLAPHLHEKFIASCLSAPSPS